MLFVARIDTLVSSFVIQHVLLRRKSCFVSHIVFHPTSRATSTHMSCADNDGTPLNGGVKTAAVIDVRSPNPPTFAQHTPFQGSDRGAGSRYPPPPPCPGSSARWTTPACPPVLPRPDQPSTPSSASSCTASAPAHPQHDHESDRHPSHSASSPAYQSQPHP